MVLNGFELQVPRRLNPVTRVILNGFGLQVTRRLKLITQMDLKCFWTASAKEAWSHNLIVWEGAKFYFPFCREARTAHCFFYGRIIYEAFWPFPVFSSFFFMCWSPFYILEMHLMGNLLISSLLFWFQAPQVSKYRMTRLEQYTPLVPIISTLLAVWRWVSRYCCY